MYQVINEEEVIRLNFLRKLFKWQGSAVTIFKQRLFSTSYIYLKALDIIYAGASKPAICSQTAAGKIATRSLQLLIQ